MSVPIGLSRVKRRLKTLVTFDNLVDVGLVYGGHADGERHFSILVLSRIHLGTKIYFITNVKVFTNFSSSLSL